jgi:hypothetical protein
MNESSRRKFMASALALSCSPYVGPVQANPSLPPIISFLLDGPIFFSGVTTSSSPPGNFDPITFCLTQSGNDFIGEALLNGLRFLDGQNTNANPNTIIMGQQPEGFELELTITSIANGLATGNFRLAFQPGDSPIDAGTFSAQESVASCEIKPPTAVFSDCLITDVVDNGITTKVAFTFKVTTNPADLADGISTIDYELSFLPSMNVLDWSGTASVDANGNGALALDSHTQPVNITGENSVSVKIRATDNFGESEVTSCTSPAFDILSGL